MKTLGSLFAGIGGFDAGFEQAGFETVWQVEIDPVCRRILARHFPNALRIEDVRECGSHNLPPVDVITFGSPCQDLSLAGKRKGLAGERSGLFFEAIRIISELQPALAVWENVPGALSSHAGRDFASVLLAFRECGARDLAWRVLDSRYFGVAQRRRRVFVVADFAGERAGEILFEPESVRRYPAAGQAAREEVAGTLGGGAGSRGWRDDTDRMTFVPEVAGTLTDCGKRGWSNSVDHLNFIPFRERRLSDYATGEFGSLRHFAGGEAGGGSETLVAHALTSGGSDASEDGTGRGTPLVCSTLASSGAGTARPSGMANEPGFLIAAPLTARSGKGGFTDPVNDGLITSRMAVRRLTPTECERLQGFEDGWTAHDAEGLPISDSARYRMLGNACTVNVCRWIARRVKEQMDR